MRRVVYWVWEKGIVSTFLAGLFAVLPLVITVAILAWVAALLHGVLGPGSAAGVVFRSLGLQFVSNPEVAWGLGVVFVLAAIWLLGLAMKSFLRRRIEMLLNGIVERIPIFKSLYSAVAQVVGMLTQKEQTDLSGMSVVFCAFGDPPGAGMLCLLATPEVYRFGERDYQMIYIPTSPVPMTGGLILVPAERVTRVEISAEELMRVYLSLGILSPQAMPARYRRGLEAVVERPPKTE